MATYAIISLGGKQYRVHEGQKLLVDRLPYDANKTFHPAILFAGGDGVAELKPKDLQVTARVVEHVLGEKIRIGKYKPKVGYKRHAGHRSKLSQVEIQAIGAKASRKPKTEAAEEKPKQAAEKPKAAAEKPVAEQLAAEQPAAEKPKRTTKKTETEAAE
jgi:large subunit ribosomal protein L21